MTKQREWIPVSKNAPCPVCGKGNWCSISATDANIVTCKRPSTQDSGWVKLKSTIDSGAVFKRAGTNSQPEPAPTMYRIEQTEHVSVSHEIRSHVYRRLMLLNGSLAALYKEDLLMRGLTNYDINKAIQRGWFSNWQRGISSDFIDEGKSIAGLIPATGITGSCNGLFLPAIRDNLIIGAQIYPRVHVEHRLGKAVDIPEGLGKYIWLSSKKKGGVGAHSFDTEENPLFLRESPEIKLECVENLNLCEGALKSAIAALRAEDRGCTEPYLGAAGGWFTEKELNLCLTRYPNLKTVTLWPDAGCLQNQEVIERYRKVRALVEQLTSGKVTFLVAWWNQKDKDSRDVDELNKQDLLSLNIQHWNDSVLGENPLSPNDKKSEESSSSKPYFTSSINEGLFRHEPDGEGGWKKPRRIGHHIKAIARVNNVEGSGAALQMEFMSYEGHLVRWTMPRSLIVSDSAVLVTELYALGYYIEDDKKRYLLQYFNNIGAEVEKKYTITDSTGWVGKSFVTQTKTYGDDSLRFKDVDRVTDTTCKVAGTLEGWIYQVAARCGGNSRLLFALGAAFAPPLLEPLGIEGGGFHFFHPTSAGKTTTLMVAASVVGIKNIPRWNMTRSGAEAKAMAHDNMLLPLDEINEADEREVGKIAYMLANGEGKARANRNATSRKSNSWQLLFISTGETGIANYIKQAGIQVRGGQEVRMPDIPAVPYGSAHGVFEYIHGCHDSKQFAQALERGTAENHGTAIDVFLTELVKDMANESIKSGLRKKVFLVADRLTGTITNHAIRRVANRFALVQVALGLAHSYGLLPFPSDQIDWAVSTMFQDWLRTRGGDGSIEISDACEAIELLLVTNEYSNRVYTLPNNDGKPVQNLLAYRSIYQMADGDPAEKQGQTKEFWVPKPVFMSEFCKGVDPSELIKELQEREWLLPLQKNGKSVYERKIKGEKMYFYIFGKTRKVQGNQGNEATGYLKPSPVNDSYSPTLLPLGVKAQGNGATTPPPSCPVALSQNR
jgi:uncharacterized protein (DUF927 family)